MPNLQESPQYIQTSLAGALGLGLERGRVLRGIQSTCLNLLLTYTQGCAASCAYCGLNSQRTVEDGSQTFIRVKWPVYPLDEILQIVGSERHAFKRICMSMITHKRALGDTATVISRFRDVTDIPISALLSPTVMRGREGLKVIKNAGADRVGVAIDLATPALFDQYRGKGVGGPHRWEVYWQTLAEALEVFGSGMAGIHLIVGMGETEAEMVQTISRAQEMGAPTHLFSFYPEAGSAMQDHDQPRMAHYRRIQLARYLINEGYVSGSAFTFSGDGRIVDFGIRIEPFIQHGLAFMTSGCPGRDGLVACNRPFANERVTQPIRNFPIIPERQDIEIIADQIRDEVI